MNLKLCKNLIIGMSLFITIQGSQAAILKDTHKHIDSSILNDKQSPIERALIQQKHGESKLISDSDQLKVLTSIKATPTQNFLAAQHQHFSRFVQALFQSHSS